MKILRNQSKAGIDWRFTAADTRIKLKNCIRQSDCYGLLATKVRVLSELLQKDKSPNSLQPNHE